MLNRALRALEEDTIINMGFFIHDLHQRIQELHRQQVGGYHEKTFTVYRGQGLSTTDFDKLQQPKGRLMSFNNFLSTSCKTCLNKSRHDRYPISNNHRSFYLVYTIRLDSEGQLLQERRRNLILNEHRLSNG